MSKNLSHLSGRKGLENNLFDRLGNAAKETGTPDLVEMQRLKDEFLFGSANIYGTVSFYDFLKKENQGKKIFVCNGSSCMTAGTQAKVSDKINTQFSKEEIGEMCCLGRCHENSAFHYNGQNYSGDAINELSTIVKNQAKINDHYHVNHYGTAVLTNPNFDIHLCQNILRNSLQRSSDELIDQLKISGLRGRGGA
ncbi:MAG TPA: NAD(P)H-dependent oxidoreductase subunit E, partial [Saprospiraceae bacterium]|nr:NAD(P)H-dependent oxidoreductase subunit E [Saprospiraceae bacterium]